VEVKAMRALPDDPRERLQLLFDVVINEGDLDAIPEFFDESYVDHGPMGDIHGLDAFRGLVEQWRAAVPDVHCTIENVIEQGELAAWIVRTTGTHTGDGLGFPATGKRFETVSVNMGRWSAGGKAVEHWSEQGMFPMLVQLGLLPMEAGAPA
jgi:predicted ester cyclase